ncbi:hypothetical protein [Candidatus Liberibacter sp.]|uniref:hypothetical protein n=1 Tax=Candidatus Liberibacter sp. TaxID=34022 RepID=UPI0015F57A4D|nr:hypothetical protein [Candidatus Liberibacter sp.]MBA5724494.1 hypothetical protein [Candidatus Liberibacter sp.]
MVFIFQNLSCLSLKHYSNNLRLLSKIRDSIARNPPMIFSIQRRSVLIGKQLQRRGSPQ